MDGRRCRVLRGTSGLRKTIARLKSGVGSPQPDDPRGPRGFSGLIQPETSAFSKLKNSHATEGPNQRKSSPHPLETRRNHPLRSWLSELCRRGGDEGRAGGAVRQDLCEELRR